MTFFTYHICSRTPIYVEVMESFIDINQKETYQIQPKGKVESNTIYKKSIKMNQFNC